MSEQFFSSVTFIGTMVFGECKFMLGKNETEKLKEMNTVRKVESKISGRKMRKEPTFASYLLGRAL